MSRIVNLSDEELRSYARDSHATNAVRAYLARECLRMRDARRAFIMKADIESGVVPFGAIALKTNELYPPEVGV